MSRVHIPRGKFNSVYGSVSNLMLKLQVRLTRKLALIVALAAGCLQGSSAAGAAGEWIVGAAPQVHSAPTMNCPSRDGLDAVLSKASEWMKQSRYPDAAAILQPLSNMDCDARAGLLLAAAYEGQGDELKATAVLRRAHSVWPSNNSVAVSLARDYLANGDKDQAVKSLAHFHGTPETPEQELEMAVVVYMAGQKLLLAQAVAEQEYKYYPSEHSLLLLSNTLQLQGRYPDVNRLLGSKKGMYGDSSEFFVTLAESEFDASIYPDARKDLQRAISLNPKLYQAHYLLGNVLAKMNDADGAIAEYHQAIDLAPDQPRTYYQLALALRSKLDDSGEQSALEQALAVDSHYAPAQCEMGSILLKDHRPSDAVEHLLAAIEDNPRLENAYFQLSRAYALLGEKDKADQMVRRLEAVREENRPGQDKRVSRSAADEPKSQ
jgi:tetratricopeptide (TPR) repeat protein